MGWGGGGLGAAPQQRPRETPHAPRRRWASVKTLPQCTLTQARAHLPAGLTPCAASLPPATSRTGSAWGWSPLSRPLPSCAPPRWGTRARAQRQAHAQGQGWGLAHWRAGGRGPSARGGAGRLRPCCPCLSFTQPLSPAQIASLQCGAAAAPSAAAASPSRPCSPTPSPAFAPPPLTYHSPLPLPRSRRCWPPLPSAPTAWARPPSSTRARRATQRRTRWLRPPPPAWSAWRGYTQPRRMRASGGR